MANPLRIVVGRRRCEEMSNNNLIGIAAIEVNMVVKDVTKNYWAFTDDDMRFRAAVAGAYVSASDKDKKRIKEEMDALGCLGAVLSGFGSIENLKPPEKPIGLFKMWQEAKDGK